MRARSTAIIVWKFRHSKGDRRHKRCHAADRIASELNGLNALTFPPEYKMNAARTIDPCKPEGNWDKLVRLVRPAE